MVQKYIPAFRIPPVILVMVGMWIMLQFILIFSPPQLQNMLINLLALWPLRFFGETQNLLLGSINLVTYSFIHGGWGHIFLNAIWFIAFATPVARRLDKLRFSLFYLTCVMLAALTQIFATGASYPDIPIVGASGGVAACMGATTRFAFPQGKFFDPRQIQNQRLVKLRDLAHNRIVVIFTILWVGLNVIFGLLGPSGASPSGASVLVAWQAHIGGFFAGMFLMGIFEPPPLSTSGGPGNVDYGNWR